MLGITNGFLKSPPLPDEVRETASPTFNVAEPLGAWPDKEVGGNSTGMLLLLTLLLCKDTLYKVNILIWTPNSDTE